MSNTENDAVSIASGLYFNSLRRFSKETNAFEDVPGVLASRLWGVSGLESPMMFPEGFTIPVPPGGCIHVDVFLAALTWQEAADLLRTIADKMAEWPMEATDE